MPFSFPWNCIVHEMKRSCGSSCVCWCFFWFFHCGLFFRLHCFHGEQCKNQNTAKRKDKTRTSHWNACISMAKRRKKSKSWSQVVISGSGRKTHAWKILSFEFQWKEKTISLLVSGFFSIVHFHCDLKYLKKEMKRKKATEWTGFFFLINADLIKASSIAYWKRKLTFNLSIEFVVRWKFSLSISLPLSLCDCLNSLYQIVGNIQVSDFNESEWKRKMIFTFH